MAHLCQVYQAVGQGAFCELTPFLARELNLKENSLVTLRCGSLSAQVNVLTGPSPSSPEKSMGLSAEVFAALKIPQNIYLTVKPVDFAHFRLGPVIGILTFPHVISKKQLNRYIDYARSMEKGGLMFVFTPPGVHPEVQTVAGFHYNRDKKSWESGEFPYPDVVMDRMYPNDYKTHFELEKVIGPNKIFNKKTLINKLEFNDVLAKDPFLTSFIPETKLFSDSQDLEYYLSKYNGVYLKPVDGMRGRGIIYVTPEKNDLLCRYMDGSAVVVKKIPGSDYIYEILGRINDYKRPYIIQAAVNKMEYMERALSFRIMATKDGTGSWSTPIMIGKSARPGSFLTNVSSGAQYVLMKDILKWIKKQLPDNNTDFINQLTNLCLKAAESLDHEFGPLGKLGIDVVLDVSGKPWLIEANGNPGVIFRKGQKEFPDWHWQVYTHPLSYALYLAGLSETDIVNTNQVTDRSQSPTSFAD